MVGRIVTIGGGGGHSVLLKGFKLYSDRYGADRFRMRNLTAVVSTADDGGSTGKLNAEFDIPAVGDLRMCLSALATYRSLKELFDHRFESTGTLSGHSLGNLLLAGALAVHESLSEGLEVACSLLQTQAKVVASTENRVRLCARLHDGWIVRGEAALAKRRRQHSGIERIFFETRDAVVADSESTIPPRVFCSAATAEAAHAVKQADLIVLAPGSLFTSIVPNLIIDDIAHGIRSSRATTIYACNLVNEQGETDGFVVRDFLAAIRNHGQFEPDYVLVNTAGRRSAMSARPVPLGPTEKHGGLRYIGSTQVVERNLADSTGNKHRPLPLAAAILEVARKDRDERRSIPRI